MCVCLVSPESVPFVRKSGFFGKIFIDNLFKFIENAVVLSICPADTATGTYNSGFLPLSRIGVKKN